MAATQGARLLAAGEFFSEVTARYRAPELTLSELRHYGRRSFPRHAHEQAYFCLVLAGGYTERVAGRWVPQRPMSLAFHPPGFEHDDEIGEHGGRLFSVEVGPRWLDRLREEAPVELGFQVLGMGEPVWLASRLHRELRGGDGSPLAVEGLVLELLAATSRHLRTRERRPPRWLVRVEELLRESFREPLALERLAAEAGVHPVHLSRTFRRFRGRTLGDYLQELRIRHVCQELADADLPLADLSLDAGFTDQSHCTRVFKRLTGMTPGVFRAALRPRDR